MLPRKTLASSLSIALAVVALAACQKQAAPETTTPVTPAEPAQMPAPDMSAPAPAATMAPAMPAPDAGPQVAYADVITTRPITSKQTVYGTVTGNEALKETHTVSQQKCEDVVVEERLPEKDGNVGGTVVGAVVGGALGNQVGKGDGKKLATVAGAVIGGIAGNKIDKAHEGGKVVSRTEQQCKMVDEPVETTTGYKVSYVRADGGHGDLTLQEAPEVGSKIALETVSKTVGYDVTYRLDGQTSTIRMDHDPGSRLTVLDGQVVTGTAPVRKN